MGSSARNGPRVSARRTRRTLPVLPAELPADDQAASTTAEPAPQADPAVATTNAAELNAIVPRGLQIAAAWCCHSFVVLASVLRPRGVRE